MVKKKKGFWERKVNTKKIKKSSKKASKSWRNASDWIEHNINPDVYSMGLEGSGLDLDVDPWNPYGTKKRKRRR